MHGKRQNGVNKHFTSLSYIQHIYIQIVTDHESQEFASDDRPFCPDPLCPSNIIVSLSKEELVIIGLVIPP